MQWSNTTKQPQSGSRGSIRASPQQRKRLKDSGSADTNMANDLELSVEGVMKSVSRIDSDMRVLAWKVATIMGIIIALANQVMNRIHL